MLDELKPDMRRLLELTRKMENYDVTLMASQSTGNPIIPNEAAVKERRRMEEESMHLRAKWGIH